MDASAAINDVVVEVYASGFVPTETAWPSTWTDRPGRDRTPSVAGHELAGVVTAVGYGTTGLSVGQRVFGLADWYRDGTLAQYVAVEARNLAPLPGDVDFAVGASLPISGLTAWQGLLEHGRLRAGQSVLVHGAAGSTGTGPARRRPNHTVVTRQGPSDADTRVSAMDHLAVLHDELARFRDCLSGDLAAPVEHCGDWNLRDLAEHLGQGNLWAAAAVTQRRGDYQPSPAPADIGPWFAESARVLTETLAIDPATEAWTFAPPRTVGFWRRRRCLETLVHRWDAQHALGIRSHFDPALCADGVAEVIEMFVPRQIRLGRLVAPTAAVRLTATDLDASWTLGPGEPVATLTATAQQLMLALWNRLPMPWEHLTGDEDAARVVLRGPLVP